MIPHAEGECPLAAGVVQLRRLPTEHGFTPTSRVASSLPNRGEAIGISCPVGHFSRALHLDSDQRGCYPATQTKCLRGKSMTWSGLASRSGWGAAVLLVLSMTQGEGIGQAPNPEPNAPALPLSPSQLPPPTVVVVSDQAPAVAPGQAPAVAPGQTPAVVPETSPATPETNATVPVVGDAVAVPNSGDIKNVNRDIRLYDSLHCDDNYGLKSLFDSLHPENPTKGKHWYEKFSVRGYAQPRFGRTLYQEPGSASPNLPADRGINGNAEDFTMRRARLILFGDVSEYLSFYWQQDFAVTLPGASTTFFGQLRDLYGDVYLDKERVNRFRVGLSKVPYGWENMQSSQNRVPLDRTDAINTAVSLNERDLGVFYYWTPKDKQKLFKDLVDGGLKGSGNFGIFALGVYNGQGLATIEQNLDPHVVARFTWPFQLASGQVVEASIQGYTGKYVVAGAPIRPLGEGDSTTPKGTGGNKGYLDQRIAGTFVWYAQPFGFQTEWNVGRGPGLNDAQSAIETRPLQGGYAMVMYKVDTARHGIFIPYTRYQHYRGGYKSVFNAPYGGHDEWDLGVEWQIRKEMELTLEYSFVNGVNVSPIDKAGANSYQNFDGGILRAQFQINY
ncbi:MAG: porin [Planctomycetaceae bacterium]|nr:porin [Planctomycetaceae bacterium]